ncbi:TetR/AcrR family transcriptional regulator [Mycobacterium sp. CSUR Q5927]|nr:TetR/AcrR family transcriptional regulator [Mycobacterium sp. CSUR Q5927]
MAAVTAAGIRRSGRPAVIDHQAPDARTRQKILRAALDWASETGLLQFSMNGVAKRARIARTTLYLHFPGKQALIDAAIDYEITALMASARGVVEIYDSLDDRVVHGFAHTYREIASNPVLQAVLQVNPQLLLPHLMGRTSTLQRGRQFATTLLRPGDLPPHLDAELLGDYAVRLMETLVLSPPPSFTARPGGPEEWARRFLLPVVHSNPPDEPPRGS